MKFESCDRRDFMKSTASLAFSGMVLAILTPKSARATNASIQSQISNNHGHIFAINLVDLQKNGATTYNIQGNSGHPHEIDITNEDIHALANGQEIELQSTQDAGHSHIVVLALI